PLRTEQTRPTAVCPAALAHRTQAARTYHLVGRAGLGAVDVVLIPRNRPGQSETDDLGLTIRHTAPPGERTHVRGVVGVTIAAQDALFLWIDGQFGSTRACS